ncbi:hypothetical protein [Pseudodesulfovibrio nedwellii]|uniref:hypothetical protein n=1 Tax=Pseudodesulfovibrio nedwellii TaxID=2973072 RepID=UPI0024932F10|nr:hypothetical protein [Pseudodesulfovibrio nedwellii]
MKHIYIFTICVLASLIPASSIASDYNQYCSKYYNKYRDIRYWAKVNISVSDFYYNSGAIKSLKLGSKSSVGVYHVADNLKKYYFHEFERLIKKDLPYHDTTKGYNKRFNKIYSKYKNDKNFFDKLDAYEIAWRESKFGTNPAALYCSIKISRTEFPILLLIQTNIVTNDTLTNYWTEAEEDLEYSDPEFVNDTIKKILTKQLTSWQRKLKQMNSCP